MPKFKDSETANLSSHAVGHFGFTAVNLDELEASGYTLATLVCDRSGSTQGFQGPMEAALKASVDALRRHPNSESMMLRVLTIDNQCEEVHGFIPLPDIDPSRYDGILSPRGMTALYDGCVNAAQASAEYGRQLLNDRFNANGIAIFITDGCNNAGRFNSKSGTDLHYDLPEVKKALESTTKKECLESFSSILIGVNVQDREVSSALKLLHDEGGFTIPLIELDNANADTIAKIGGFITDSVSSSSQALGTGGPSKSISF